MKMKLDKVLELSAKGYIDDPAEIEEILERLAKVKLSTLQNSRNKDLGCIVEAFTSDYSIPSSYNDDITYEDILCMIYDTNTDFTVSQMSSFFTERIMSALRAAETNSTAVKLFMSISVSAYIKYLAEKAGKSYSMWYESLCYDFSENTEIKLTESTTIRKFCDVLSKNACKSWNPCSLIKKFEDSVNKSYQLLFLCMVERYRQAFPKCFNLQKMKEKYPSRTAQRLITEAEQIEFKEVI